NHCVNDILVQGARPLVFLDYLATGRLSPDVAASVVSGLARACQTNGCALLGGETAEMPGFYADEEYDLAGFIVGAVDRARIIDGRTVAPGDVLIGLPSSGLHTNGYSLARRIVFERLGLTTDTNVPEIGRDLGGALLVPHRTYLPVVEPLLKRDVIKAMAHITGGGITDNLPRVLPQGVSAEVDRGAWEIPALFQWLQAAGDVRADEMYRTFNMGIGLILVCGEANAASLVAQLRERGEPNARVIGRVVPGARIVVYR
ncbi:MAG: phosphoribosylformylglycinamidine cyclo-ligase, partial [Vicinamibacteraceae bacterium]